MRLEISGRYDVRVLRDGKTIFEDSFCNGITDEGKNEMLATMFHSTAKATWYIGLLASITNLSALDTMASHAGWTELTGYTSATRPAWAPDAPSAKAITNATYLEFVLTAGATIYGLFAVNESTKSGTTGKLWSTAAFTAAGTFTNGDVVQVKYTVSIG